MVWTGLYSPVTILVAFSLSCRSYCQHSHSLLDGQDGQSLEQMEFCFQVRTAYAEHPSGCRQTEFWCHVLSLSMAISGQKPCALRHGLSLEDGHWS
ncbi:Uncharacterized protein HZ326_21962 [Fusarium oxysporum f. sp. albedinis]|nr:Uncharacterized protein HZ326_21962 [Fusarium oxysporum f. sp. albedinis]